MTDPSRSRTRIGIVQWHMERAGDLDTLLARALWFIDTLADAGARLVQFPEFFSVPLLAGLPGDTPAQRMQRLAALTPRILATLGARAAQHDLWLAAGSLPEIRGGHLQNVATLLAPDGTRHVQPKIHVTPAERATWGFTGGDSLRVVDTPCGRVGILVCYDIEFPELGRVLADRGVEILCVPSRTDSRTGFLRVQRCAAARAIENECYVLLSGSTGFLAAIEGVDNQYAQSAVFTPADTPFPPDAFAAQADANVEQYLLADLDLALLRELRSAGAVTNGKDRRRELCTIDWLGR